MASGNRPAWRRAPKVQAYNRSAACQPRARRLQNVPACLTARQSGHQNHGWNRLSSSVEAGDESVPAFVTERYLETLPGVRRDSRKPSRKNIPYRLKVGRDPGPAWTKVWRCLHPSGAGKFFGLRPSSEHLRKPKSHSLSLKYHAAFPAFHDMTFDNLIPAIAGLPEQSLRVRSSRHRSGRRCAGRAGAVARWSSPQHNPR